MSDLNSQKKADELFRGTALFFCLSPNSGLGADIQVELAKHPELEIVEMDRALSATHAMTKFRVGFIVFSIGDKNQLLEVIALLDGLKAEISSGFIRVFGICKLNHPKLEVLLQKKGCGEILTPDISKKAIQFKMDRYFRSIESPLRNREAFPKAKKEKDPKKSDGGQVIRSRVSPVKWVDSLRLEADIFIVRKMSDVRKVIGRWMIELTAPGPSIGKWEKSEMTFGQAEPAWEWQPRSVEKGTDDPFIRVRGIWIFLGAQPEFSWKSLKWRFVSANPALHFVSGQDVLESRFRLGPNEELLVAQNSPYALGLLPEIMRPIMAEARFQQEKSRANGGEVLFFEKPKSRSGPELEIEKELSESRELMIELDPERARAWNVDLAEEAEEEERNAEALLNPMGLTIGLRPDSASENAPPIPSRLFDAIDSGLILEVPAGTCRAGDTSRCDVAVASPKLKFSVTGKVESVEPSEAGREVITLSLIKYERADLEALFAAFHQRQAGIVKFMKAAKG